MKILVIGNRDRYEKFSLEHLNNPAHEIVFSPGVRRMTIYWQAERTGKLF
ncbi:MAG: hypothetical protein LBT16_14830 [Treponema sp.]|nr:hypothetical protein [Treponema sp.]